MIIFVPVLVVAALFGLAIWTDPKLELVSEDRGRDFVVVLTTPFSSQRLYSYYGYDWVDSSTGVTKIRTYHRTIVRFRKRVLLDTLRQVANEAS